MVEWQYIQGTKKKDMIHVQLYSISLFFNLYNAHTVIMALCKFQYLNYKANTEIILGVDSVYKL